MAGGYEKSEAPFAEFQWANYFRAHLKNHPVIDNFERALAVDPAKVDPAAILKGMQIVHDQWLAMLAQEKVEVIAPAGRSHVTNP